MTFRMPVQGLPGVKGPRGRKGGWTVIDAMKKCKELGGKVYLGICLKSQRLDADADTVPFKCSPYQVITGLVPFACCIDGLS
jgi:hypothetical protein